MKDLGSARKILSMEIFEDTDKKVLHLSRGSYIRKILERYEMKDAKLTELSLAGHFRLSKTMGPQTEVEVQKMERVSYASGVGSLICTMVCCRSDMMWTSGLGTGSSRDPSG